MEAVEVNSYTIEAGVNLEGVIADGSTVWPGGFNPVAAGTGISDPAV